MNISKESEDDTWNSLDNLNISRTVNFYLTLLFIIIGLFGNFLTIFVFVQNRFRKNSSNVYLLCLAINDSVYLVVHFFEDTVKNYKSLYSDDKNFSIFLYLFDLVDSYDFVCKSFSYLRYVLRFISAYIIIAFTIQRLFLVYKPLSNFFKSKRSAWMTTCLIVISSLYANFFVLFLFQIKKDESSVQKYCDVDTKWSSEYFNVTLIYVIVIMIVPIAIIILSNSIIITSIIKADSQNIRITVKKKKKSAATATLQRSFKSFNLNLIEKQKDMLPSQTVTIQRPYYLNINQIINKVSKKSNSSQNLTRLLIFISFSYVLFNLPYLICWFIFYYIKNFRVNRTDSQENHIFLVLKITEILYLLNYSINFYIYCASGSVFRQQLKYSG